MRATKPFAKPAWIQTTAGVKRRMGPASWLIFLVVVLCVAPHARAAENLNFAPPAAWVEATDPAQRGDAKSAGPDMVYEVQDFQINVGLGQRYVRHAQHHDQKNEP